MVVRLRTIRQAVAEVKAADPGSCLTEHALRRLVKAGLIPSITSGSRNLISMEALEEYCGGGRAAPSPAGPESGLDKIRRIG